MIFSGSTSCIVSTPAAPKKIQSIPAPPEKIQKIYKWVDESGVIHYGEKELGRRIDKELHELTIIQAETRKVNIQTNTRDSRSAANVNAEKVKREQKKRKCAALAGKRDSYSMRSSQYKRYSTQHAHECIF